MPITASKYIVSGGNFRKTLDFRTLVIRDWEFQVIGARLWFIRSSDNLLRKTNSNKKTSVITEKLYEKLNDKLTETQNQCT